MFSLKEDVTLMAWHLYSVTDYSKMQKIIGEFFAFLRL